ncbi:MAG: tRNA (5-methylaminomethyl-2-thiouridylate)-methyltransferase [Nitrososphaeraceae archaeon]
MTRNVKLKSTRKKMSVHKKKAVALLSGGLDSNLAIRMIQDQGVEVEAVAIKTPFCDFDCGKGCGHRVKEVATELGIKLKTIYFGEEYLQMLKNPKHGYGSGMNPCIDCRSMMYSVAKEHMKKIGAEFIVTGEVLGQRPMSQNKNALSIIENETGTMGVVVRPLSSKHLPITNPEKNGLIKRENLGNIIGRSRKGQLRLAEKYDISDPPNSAGGCLLTDPIFAKRIKDLYKHNGAIPDINDVELLKLGRHFRVSGDKKFIVGRSKEENRVLEVLSLKKDLKIMVKDYVGPTCILRGNKPTEDEIMICARIAVRYSDAPKDNPSIVKIIANQYKKEISALPLDNESIAKIRI